MAQIILTGIFAKNTSSPNQINRANNLKDKNVPSAQMGTFACNEQEIQAMVETVKSMIESHNGKFIEFTFK